MEYIVLIIYYWCQSAFTFGTRLCKNSCIVIGALRGVYMKRLLFIGVLLSLWFASCTPEPYASMPLKSNLAPSQFESVLETPSAAVSQVACTQGDLPVRSPALAASLVANLNLLGIELYHTLTENDDDNNLIFSPYGVVSALSAAYAAPAVKQNLRWRKSCIFCLNLNSMSNFAPSIVTWQVWQTMQNQSTRRWVNNIYHSNYS